MRANPGKLMTATVGSELKRGPVVLGALTLKVHYPRTRRAGHITSTRQAVTVFRRATLELPQEEFWALMLDGSRRPLGTFMAHRGGMQSSMVEPASVFRPAVLLGAEAIYFCHNHPSGDPTPSIEDVEITNLLIECGEILRVKVIEHVVIGTGGRWHAILEHRGYEQ